MKQRIITGVIAAALFIPFVVYGGVPFILLVYLLGTIALQELLKMKGRSLRSIPGLISLLALYAFMLPNQWALQVYEWTGYEKVEFAFLAVILLLIHTVIVKNSFTFDDAAFAILGTLYVGIGFFYFIETREASLSYLVFALLVVWFTDSGAYFTGRKIGKRKLWPEISPNKTIEGFVGGIVWAIGIALVFNYFIPLNHSIILIIIVTIIASVFGQMGDLVESALKRHFNVKDSGAILPGHGGILDRFDSILFVMPLLHFLHFV
ncbi:phosphatidate cytidylyltransferase [Planococcus antarcticus DSM 14505]|uniref:Phosphatidate cytidylyltransferase n=1 Tax=Planococcus antarcticus DSM 14505 TaxID=1185653 RepID=A0A1C7DG73_9BACL|nr:phosphatidate cytidylyltransferase [Planococcus antarcticus]ANU10550.1 phosphatidate cytidylyltransferase [Planococcus antarcticus DSM 14505]EIM08375.1 phosphatidate cytidylyltransferase [Planococcus antarcticus DSM 14505]